MKKILTLIGLSISLISFSQDLFSIEVLSLKKTNSLILNERSASTIYYSKAVLSDKNYFLIVKLKISKSKESPRYVKPKDIFILNQSDTLNATGELDENGMYKTRFTGTSHFGASVVETIVFEVPISLSKPVLQFWKQEVKLGTPTSEDVKLKTPSFEVHKIEQVDFLNKPLKGGYGVELKATLEVRPNTGKFTVVEIIANLEDGGMLRQKDFLLKAENGTEIICIGGISNDEFVNNSNTGSKKGNGGTNLTLVFPTGNLSTKDLSELYQLTYKGLKNVKLK